MSYKFQESEELYVIKLIGMQVTFKNQPSSSRHWREYQEWLSAGNTTLPADPE